MFGGFPFGSSYFGQAGAAGSVTYTVVGDVVAGPAVANAKFRRRHPRPIQLTAGLTEWQAGPIARPPVPPPHVYAHEGDAWAGPAAAEAEVRFLPVILAARVEGDAVAGPAVPEVVWDLAWIAITYRIQGAAAVNRWAADAESAWLPDLIARDDDEVLELLAELDAWTARDIEAAVREAVKPVLTG